MRREPGTLHVGKVVNGPGALFLGPEERKLHTYVVGATGTGKSKFLENLLRQDILDNARTGSGLLLLDPHGNLYDDLMRWMATHRLKRRVVPIDLRRDDWIVAYNLLRRRHRPDGREVAAAVVIDSFVQAMAHAWGAQGTDETPLLARWISAIMHALYERGLTVTDSLHLTDRMARDVREFLTQQMADPIAARHWQFANAIRPTEFDQQVSSSINRLERFLHGEVLPKMFGQVEVSFDFGPAMEEGWIVLVNLSTRGGNVSEENARVCGTLMLTDLWGCAQHRGKQEGVKPFYVYLDEFQKFITPTIAENLDEARGFGLWLTMAHQFPAQLLHGGPAGEKLYDSVMENARNKVVFCLQNPKNLEPLAHWLFMGTMNPDEIKHQLYSTKVMDYKIEYHKAYSHTAMSSTGGATQHGSVSGSGTSGARSGSASQSFDADGGALGSGSVDASTQAWNSYHAETYSDSYTWSGGEADSESDVPMLIPIMGKEVSAVQFRSLDEQLFRAMAVLFDQQQRQAVVRLANSKTPVSLFVPNIEPGYARPERVQALVQNALSAWPFALSFEEAKKRIAEREKALLAQVRPAISAIEAACDKMEGSQSSLPDAMSATSSPSQLVEASALPAVNVGGVELRERDWLLLRDLFQTRFTTIRHALQMGFGNTEDAVRKRLNRLADPDVGLLTKHEVNAPGTRQIFVFTAKAFDVLREHGALAAWLGEEWTDAMRKRFDVKSVKDSTLRHELGMLDLRAALVPALRAHPHLALVTFPVWQAEVEFPVIRKGREILQRPDGLIEVAVHRHPGAASERVVFYIEYDRGTETHERIFEKVEGYLQQRRRLKGQPFRVLFVLDTPDAAKRCENLAELLAEKRVKRFVLLATREDLLRNPLGLIAITPTTWRKWLANGRRNEIEHVALFADDTSSSAPQSVVV